MDILINDKKFLEKYNEIWDKVSNSFNKGFNGEWGYNKEYVKTKIKYHGGKINSNFHGDKIP